MENQMNLSTWITQFKEGAFEKADLQTQIKAGWFDWFCKDTSLPNKTKRMGSIVKQIKPGGKVDLEKSYVWFKNNCPMSGPLYDDFRIADLQTGHNLMVIQVDSVYNEKKYSVYVLANNYSTPVFESDSSKELVRWLNAKEA